MKVLGFEAFAVGASGLALQVWGLGFGMIGAASCAGAHCSSLCVMVALHGGRLSEFGLVTIMHRILYLAGGRRILVTPNRGGGAAACTSLT